jgi:outer membrane immunogenic protein
VLLAFQLQLLKYSTRARSRMRHQVLPCHDTKRVDVFVYDNPPPTDIKTRLRSGFFPPVLEQDGIRLVEPPPPFSWTGFYVGGNIGGAWSHSTITDNLTGASLSTGNVSGFIGGGQLGYNFQTGNFVFGVEGTFEWSSLERTSRIVATAVGNLQATASSPWITSIAARFGYAADRYLIYGKAGGGWVDNKLTVSNLTTGLSATATNSNGGLLLGIGGEYAINQNWTAKIEYDHIGLGTWTAASPIAGDRITAKREINMLTAGFNYKFQGFGL